MLSVVSADFILDGGFAITLKSPRASHFLNSPLSILPTVVILGGQKYILAIEVAIDCECVFTFSKNIK